MRDSLRKTLRGTTLSGRHSKRNHMAQMTVVAQNASLQSIATQAVSWRVSRLGGGFLQLWSCKLRCYPGRHLQECPRGPGRKVPHGVPFERFRVPDSGCPKECFFECFLALFDPKSAKKHSNNTPWGTPSQVPKRTPSQVPKSTPKALCGALSGPGP